MILIVKFLLGHRKVKLRHCLTQLVMLSKIIQNASSTLSPYSTILLTLIVPTFPNKEPLKEYTYGELHDDNNQMFFFCFICNPFFLLYYLPKSNSYAIVVVEKTQLDFIVLSFA